MVRRKRYRIGAKEKTVAILPEGKGKALLTLQQKFFNIGKIPKNDLINFLKKKRFALETARAHGTRLEQMSRAQQEQLALDCLLRTQHRIASNSKFFYREVSPERLKELKGIIRQLEAKGILCEIIVSVSKKGNRRIVKVKNIGKSILQVKITKNLLEKVAELIGKMHAAGIEHLHPHQGNIVVSRKGRLGLIDLSLASKRKVDWKSSQSIYLAFKEDYSTLNRAFGAFLRSSQETKNFFEKIVSKYPASKKVKAAVFDSIDNFVKHRITSKR